MVRKVISGIAGALAVTAAVASAASAAEFYKGKRVILYVAASPGGGYATYARAIARHWNR